MIQLHIMRNHSGKIIITAHHKPDGDAMGSTLGLYNYFKNAGIDSSVIVPTDYASNLNWLPGNDDVRIYADDMQACDNEIKNADILNRIEIEKLDVTLSVRPGNDNEEGKLHPISRTIDNIIDIFSKSSIFQELKKSYP